MKLLLFTVAFATFSGCMTLPHSTRDVMASKDRHISNAMQRRELELMKEKNRAAEIEAKQKRDLAEIEERKKRELAAIEAKKARELAEIEAKKMLDAQALKTKEEQLRTQRIEDLKKRYAALHDTNAMEKLDFQSEIAWAEKPFVDDNGEYATNTSSLASQNKEIQLRAEYARLLRVLRDGLTITQEDWTNVVVGAVVVGRINVLKWAFPHVGDIDIVSKLDPMRRTPLLWALGGANAAVLEFVWDVHPAFDIYDAKGATPLHYAVRRGSLYDVNRCLKLRKDMVNVPDSNGETPLYIAIAKSRLDLAKTLLVAQAKVDIKKKDGRSPFAYACGRGELAFLELLEHYGARPTDIDFVEAIRGGHLDVVKWFVEKRHFSVNSGNGVKDAPEGSRVREYLLKRGAIL